jgi:hypothetical protein
MREYRQQENLIYHIETGHCAGFVAPLKNGKGFSVHRTMRINYNECDKIGVVKSMDDALPKLAEYYERHWPQWKRIRDAQYHGNAGYSMCTQYWKWSVYGVFRGRQQDDGRWVATRCCDALLLGGKEAFFSTAELARHVVDLHERDGFGNFPAINDGFSWDGRPFLGPGAYQPVGQ